MLYEITTTVLLAVICFLLYQLYRIKYKEGRGKTEFVPEKLKRDLENLGSDGSSEISMRLSDMSSKISELEGKMGKNERVVEKLIEELG